VRVVLDALKTLAGLPSRRPVEQAPIIAIKAHPLNDVYSKRKSVFKTSFYNSVQNRCCDSAGGDPVGNFAIIFGVEYGEVGIFPGFD
jgi:hypothetical protein